MVRRINRMLASAMLTHGEQEHSLAFEWYLANAKSCQLNRRDSHGFNYPFSTISGIFQECGLFFYHIDITSNANPRYKVEEQLGSP